MWAGDPETLAACNRFVRMVRECVGICESDCHKVPYEDGETKGDLPAFRFTPAHPKSTIVVFGGGDSYIEEFIPVLYWMRDGGYDVVCFDGPGHGGALEDYHLTWTNDWYKPGKAMLDYFHLDDVTLLGTSGGGMLVLRAAAFEPRAKRIICHDILFDTYDLWPRQLPPLARVTMKRLSDVHASVLFNALIRRIMKKNMTMDWAMRQMAHLSGTKTPYDYMQVARGQKTGGVSHLVKQDVLVMAGQEDFTVPVDQFYRHIEALKNVRLLTARLFTRAEQAQNHCQVGNLKLQLEFVTDWIDLKIEKNARYAA